MALDVVRCPWAIYFRSVGQQDLGATALCGADLKLAEIRSFDLNRNGLLMTDAPCCGFRFTQKNKWLGDSRQVSTGMQLGKWVLDGKITTVVNSVNEQSHVFSHKGGENNGEMSGLRHDGR